MDELRQLVCDLENERDTNKQITKLQEIGRKLLTEYVIKFRNIVIEPLRVEAYYYPYNDTSKFDDPCAHPSSTKVNNFGHLYFIEGKYGYPGVDLCLSLGDYYLSFLIKNSRVDGKLFKQMDLYEEYQNDWKEIGLFILNSKNKSISFMKSWPLLQKSTTNTIGKRVLGN